MGIIEGYTPAEIGKNYFKSELTLQPFNLTPVLKLLKIGHIIKFAGNYFSYKTTEHFKISIRFKSMK